MIFFKPAVTSLHVEAAVISAMRAAGFSADPIVATLGIKGRPVYKVSVVVEEIEPKDRGKGESA